MTLPADFVFSQSSLQDYVDCPSRFQLKYLLRQRWPAPQVDDMLEFERRIEQGERFHRLVHQHQIGLPPDLLTRRLEQTDPVLRWFDTYLQTALTDLPAQRHPEITLNVPLGDFALMAKFDLVAVAPGEQAVIVDWKTGQHIPRAELLTKRLQTIVYRYVLAKGGAHLNGGTALRPEQIEMIYWYVDHDGETRRFPYDSQQYAADEAYLLALVQEISTRADFPLTTDEIRCRFCIYRSLHDRGTQAGSLAAWEEIDEREDLNSLLIDFDQIAEIEF